MMESQKLTSFRKMALPLFMALLLLLSIGAAYALTQARQSDNARRAVAAMNKVIESTGFVPVAPASLRLSPVTPMLAWQQGPATNRRTLCRFVLPLPTGGQVGAAQVACKSLYMEVARQLPAQQYTNHNVERAPHRPTLYLYSGVTPNQPGFVLVGAIRRGHHLEALTYAGTGQRTALDNVFFLYLLRRLEQLSD